MRRDDFVDIALELFGARGYDATSVADIQRAAGLTGGSGALYKHFASKHDVLAEGVRAYVGSVATASAELVAALPEDPREALEAMARAVLAAMAGERPMIRLGLRDLEQFPDLLDLLWEGVLASLYLELTGWITAQKRKGRVTVEDAGAVAAVLVASLTYFRVLEALTGHTPGDVGVRRYKAAWVAQAAAALGL